MDIVSTTGGDIQIYDGTNNATRSFAELEITGDNHLKIVIDGTSVKYFVDSVEVSSKQFNLNIGTARVGFRTLSTGSSIKYKNFCIYPI